MATYISLVQFTDKGIHAAKETTQRIADWAAKVQSKGVSIKQMYWTLGHYDQVCVFEAPNDETAASVLLSADILGNIRTQTFVTGKDACFLAIMNGAPAGPQSSSVESLRDEGRLYRDLARASTTGQWATL